MIVFRVTLVLLLEIALVGSATAAITDFDTWTLVGDPDHPALSGSATPAAAFLSAGNVPIPAGTDLGYHSVNGRTPETSTTGTFFDSSSDFSLAIDYSWAFSGTPNGSLWLGFGIGEHQDGRDSAGVLMATSNGSPFFSFGGAARINDQTLLPEVFATPATLSGSLFVDYVAASGDVIVGAASTTDASSPVETKTFSGIQKQWSGGDLMASFFIRSDPALLNPNWQGGQADAVFSNLRVLSGSPVAIPEPGMMPVLASCGVLVWLGRRRKRVCIHTSTKRQRVIH